MTDDTTLQNQAYTLRREAVNLLNGIIGLPADTNSLAVERFVDCVISAAILQVAEATRRARS